MPNPDSCCCLTGEGGWHQMTVLLSHSATATDSCPRGGFPTCAVWSFWNLRGKMVQLSTAGCLPLRDSKQRRCTSPPIVFNQAAQMKCSKSFKTHWEVRLQHWPAYRHGTQKQWRLIRKMKQKEFGPEMDEREWKFPELSEQAQHYIMSQLLPSLGHYLFIGSMNEVDLSASSTSLFVNSALEDFPCIPMNYFCANQSLNKFSSTDSRNLGVSVCKKTVPSFSSKTLWRELLGPQGCAKPRWVEKTNMILQCLGNWGAIGIVSKGGFCYSAQS